MSLISPPPTSLLDKALDEVDFCVIDLETTGFSPYRDEILEIGCVRVAPDGRVTQSFSSLLRPEGPIGGSEVHGIQEDDVAGAPLLRAVAGHVFRCLDGAVLVCYNLSFDFSFLRRHLLEPFGGDVEVPRLCCMYLRGLTGQRPSRRRLQDALEEQGLPAGQSHAAYDDAMATALLLAAYLQRARAQVSDFSGLAARGSYKFLDSWSAPLCALPRDLPTAPPHPRRSALGPLPAQAPVPEAWPSEVVPVQQAVHRVWSSLSRLPTEGEEAYVDCLCAALGDRLLTSAEMSHLTDCARYHGLGNAAVDALHQQVYAAVAAEAASDGVVTDAEARDLVALAGLLGVALPADLDAPEEPTRKSVVVTTDEEREAGRRIEALVSDELPEGVSVHHKDTVSYFALHLGSSRRWFVRLFLGTSRPHLTTRLTVEQASSLVPHAVVEPCPPNYGGSRVRIEDLDGLWELGPLYVGAVQHELVRMGAMEPASAEPEEPGSPPRPTRSLVGAGVALALIAVGAAAGLWLVLGSP